MMRRTKIILFSLCLCSGFAEAQSKFNLASLEAMALESSRAIQASRNQVSAASYAVDSASAFPNPELEYLNGSTQPRGLGGTRGEASSASLTQPIDLPWRRSARIDVAKAGLAVAQASAMVFEADSLARLRLRYFDVLRRDAELRNAQEDRKLVETVRGRIALRVDAGESPRFELIKAEAEALNAAKIAQAAAYRLDQARSLLRQIVGVELPADFALEGSLAELPNAALRDPDSLQLDERSLDLARARTEMVRAQRQLDLERAQRWPELALKATMDRDPDMRTAKVGVVVTIPIWDRRSGQVNEAAANLARARNEFEAQNFALRQSLIAAQQQYEIAETQVTALESGIVRQAETALKVAEAAYRFGERSFLEVLDAQRVYRAARAELTTARYELAAAWVEIERLRAVPRDR